MNTKAKTKPDAKQRTGVKLSKLRVIVPLLIMVVVGVAFVLHASVGTLSAFGWGDIALLCPLGALETLLASKTPVPRVVISIIVAVVLIVLFGKAFCGWVCPVPLVSKLRGFFSRGDGKKEELPLTGGAVGANAPTEGVKRAAKTSSLDSRHFVLGGALLSSLIFGFPVFCLACPIGLTFATIFLVILLFSGGDVTWSVVVVPVLLLVEAAFFRKWCTKICPVGAFMSLIAKANKTLRPHADTSTCVDGKGGSRCGACARACPQHIDPRHRERGVAINECIKCHACAETCPAHAIKFTLVDKKE